ncbi:MAG TPA: aspartate/glutamate racemase family protein [Symbiobacteriaceae bacterium]|jgi:Asp/Glu/hydantoin racemase
MSKTVVIVHTGPVTMQPLNSLALDLLPDTRVFNIVDDSLLKDVMAAGHVTPAVTKRLAQYYIIAEEMGADVILNACSSVGEAADVAAQLVAIPVVKVDTAMAEAAVATAATIGVAATVQTTLDPTARLIERTAREMGKQVTVRPVLCPGAFSALLNGNMEKHDQIVSQELLKLAGEVDVIVLAQVSMGRVATALGDTVKVPVLTSPRLGMARVAKVLNEQER